MAGVVITTLQLPVMLGVLAALATGSMAPAGGWAAWAMDKGHLLGSHRAREGAPTPGRPV